MGGALVELLANGGDTEDKGDDYDSEHLTYSSLLVVEDSVGEITIGLVGNTKAVCLI